MPRRGTAFRQWIEDAGRIVPYSWLHAFCGCSRSTARMARLTGKIDVQTRRYGGNTYEFVTLRDARRLARQVNSHKNRRQRVDAVKSSGYNQTTTSSGSKDATHNPTHNPDSKELEAD